jgi:hypothetical protein
MAIDQIEANLAQPKETSTQMDAIVQEAYSSNLSKGIQTSGRGQEQPSALDFTTNDIYKSNDKGGQVAETKWNETSDAERVTPLAQRQRADRLAANADVDQAPAVTDKQHLPSSLKDNSAAEPKVNEIAEANRVTPLAQSQRLQRLAANADVIK